MGEWWVVVAGGPGEHAERAVSAVSTAIEAVGSLTTDLADRVCDEGRDGLLAVVKVHEATDVALHVRLVARVLELAAQLHHLVPVHGRRANGVGIAGHPPHHGMRRASVCGVVARTQRARRLPESHRTS